jgi:hypothetical protein
VTLDLDAATLLGELVAALERRPDLAARIRAVVAPPAPERIYATPAQAAKHFGVSRRTLFKLLAEGLPAIGSGRARRVDIGRATEWLRARGQADDAVELRARRDATRAARKALP